MSSLREKIAELDSLIGKKNIQKKLEKLGNLMRKNAATVSPYDLDAFRNLLEKHRKGKIDKILTKYSNSPDVNSVIINTFLDAFEEYTSDWKEEDKSSRGSSAKYIKERMLEEFPENLSVELFPEDDYSSKKAEIKSLLSNVLNELDEIAIPEAHKKVFKTVVTKLAGGSKKSKSPIKKRKKLARVIDDDDDDDTPSPKRVSPPRSPKRKSPQKKARRVQLMTTTTVPLAVNPNFYVSPPKSPKGRKSTPKTSPQFYARYSTPPRKSPKVKCPTCNQFIKS